MPGVNQYQEATRLLSDLAKEPSSGSHADGVVTALMAIAHAVLSLDNTTRQLVLQLTQIQSRLH